MKLKFEIDLDEKIVQKEIQNAIQKAAFDKQEHQEELDLEKIFNSELDPEIAKKYIKEDGLQHEEILDESTKPRTKHKTLKDIAAIFDKPRATNKPAYSILKVDKKPDTNIIFFNEDYGHIIRIDEVSHEVAKRLKESSEGNTWYSKVIDMKNDKTGFDSLPQDAKEVFQLNIVYQTMMDSGVTKGITDNLIKCISTPIWELLYRRIAGEEMVHAESYSYCLAQVFGHETDNILNLIYTDKFVQKRMEKEAELFSHFNYIIEQCPNITLYEKRRALLDVIIALLALESIKFPFSFLITFNLNDSYGDKIPGFTQNIRLIAHDELTTHVPTGVNLLEILKNESIQGFFEFMHSIDGESNSYFENRVIEYVDVIVEQELDWAHYLLDNRKIKGLNYEIAEYFIKWRANHTLRLLGLNDKSKNKYTEYKKEGNSTIEFFENYRDLNKMNVAQQEASNTNYQKGTMKDDL